MYPSYLNFTKKELNLRIKKLFDILKRCEICPRKCRVNRVENEKNGFCRLGFLPMVSAFHPHSGEEKPLVGSFGSGTIFFFPAVILPVFIAKILKFLNWESEKKFLMKD